MNADELQAELNRLWSRVTTPSDADDAPPAPPPSSAIDSPVRSASIEAMQLLRRQREAETAQLRHLLALKEREASELAERLKSAQAEVLEFRRSESRRERQALAEMGLVSAKLQDAQAALRQQEERFAQEEAALRGIAERTRQQLASETARWRELERQWNEREQQYLLDLKEAQAIVRRAEEAAGRHEEKARKLTDDLKQAKGAVEATLAELLNERKLRETADQERDRALKKVAEVEEHFQELQKIWKEERAQWQELWERERSSWETRQGEMSGWEQKFRAEREAWHAELKAREEADLRHAEQMARSLRESSEASSKLAVLLRGLRPYGPEGGSALGGRLARGLALAAALVAVGLPVWRYAVRLRLIAGPSAGVAAENPTAITVDGNTLWLAEWSGRMLALDASDPSRVLSETQVSGAGAYHPAALAASGDSLWSVDTAQARIVRHAASDPSAPRDAWPAPGPAPLAAAHDGRSLWVYDGVNRSLYRVSADGPSADARALLVGLDVVPTSMQWLDGDLWMHDSKGRRLLRLKVLPNGVELAEQVSLEPGVLSVAVARTSRGRELWALTAGAGRGHAVKRFQLKAF